jgi:hypothetical protein
MNAPLFAEVQLGNDQDPQPRLPLAAGGVARWIWEHRFGAMLIEVRGDEVWVNGERVCVPSPS